MPMHTFSLSSHRNDTNTLQLSEGMGRPLSRTTAPPPVTSILNAAIANAKLIQTTYGNARWLRNYIARDSDVCVVNIQ